jgi:hypothetical protein
MLISQVQKNVLTDGAKLVRYRKQQWVKGQAIEYDVKPLFTGNKRGWILLDHTTASALDACYQALSPDNQAKWDRIPLTRLVDFAWGQVKLKA